MNVKLFAFPQNNDRGEAKFEVALLIKFDIVYLDKVSCFLQERPRAIQLKWKPKKLMENATTASNKGNMEAGSSGGGGRRG